MCSRLHCPPPPKIVMIRGSCNLKSDVGKVKRKVLQSKNILHFQSTKCKSIHSCVFQDENWESCCQVLMSLCYPQPICCYMLWVLFRCIAYLNNFFLHLPKWKPYASPCATRFSSKDCFYYSCLFLHSELSYNNSKVTSSLQSYTLLENKADSGP